MLAVATPGTAAKIGFELMNNLESANKAAEKALKGGATRQQAARIGQASFYSSSTFGRIGKAAVKTGGKALGMESGAVLEEAGSQFGGAAQKEWMKRVRRPADEKRERKKRKGYKK